MITAIILQAFNLSQEIQHHKIVYFHYKQKKQSDRFFSFANPFSFHRNTLGTVKSVRVLIPSRPSATLCDTMCCIVTKCRLLAQVSRDKIFFSICEHFLDFEKILGL